MSINKCEFIFFLLITITFLLIIFLSNLVEKIFTKNKELSRKTAHLAGALVCLSFPYLFKTPLFPAILSIGFLLFLILMKLLNKLSSIHGVERKSWGAFLFPIAILLILYIGYDKPVFYFISILVLAVSDTAAALIGKRYGSIKFDIEGNLKSLEGTCAFAILTFIIVEIPLLLMTNMPPLQCIIIALVICIVVCGFELISINGTDNIFVPLGTFFIIERMSGYPLFANFNTLWQLLISITIAILVFIKTGYIKSSFIISMSLFIFAFYSLASIKWFIPAVIYLILISIILFIYNKKYRTNEIYFNVKETLYFGIIPAVIVFFPAKIGNYNEIFPIFLLSMALLIIFIFDYYINGYINKKYLFQFDFIICIVSILFILTIPSFLIFKKILFSYIFFVLIISIFSYTLLRRVIIPVVLKKTTLEERIAHFTCKLDQSLITITIIIAFIILKFLIK